MLGLFGVLEITGSRGHCVRQKAEVTKMDCLWHKFGICQTRGRYHDSLLLDGISSFQDGTAGTLY